MFVILFDFCKTLNFAKSLGKKYLLKFNGSYRRNCDIGSNYAVKKSRALALGIHSSGIYFQNKPFREVA